MPYVQSAALEKIAYDAASCRLHATFRGTGRTYVYEDVPQDIYDGLLFADSMGGFFNAHVRDCFSFYEED